MRTSSLAQREFEFAETSPLMEAGALSPTAANVATEEAVADAEVPGAPAGSEAAGLRVPVFDASVVAITTRLAGRINAASISESEHESLHQERQRLLTKMFDGVATPAEQNRLQYVRWSLDRIEDAKHGADLDMLETYVRQYEELGRNITSLLDQLNQYRKDKIEDDATHEGRR